MIDKKELLVKLQAVIAKELPEYELVLKKAKGGRGRPPKWKLYEQLDLVQQYGELREVLEEIEGSDAASLTPKRGEAASKFYGRMSKVVQRLNRGCTLAWRSERDTAARTKPMPTMFTGDALLWNELCQIKSRPIPLSPKVALKIAKLGWQTKRLRRDRLICALLAFHELNEPKRWNTVRRLVERGEADFPILDSKRRPRSSKY